MPLPSRLALPVALATSFALACSHSSDTGIDRPDASPIAPVDGSSAAPDDAGTTALQLVVEPDQGTTPIYDFVSSAKKTIDMTMYELNDDTFTGLLTSAATNGIVVRVILDTNLEGQTNTPAYNTLAATKGVIVHWANPTYAATHQKTITIDGTTSAIMTLNLAADEYATSRDFAVITNDPNDVAAIETTFAADLASASITPPTGDDIVWSPTNSESSLLGIINGAKSTLLVENEEMGDYDIVNALKSASGHGVDVQVVMENSSDYASEFTELVGAGVKLVTYQHSKLYIHAKIILADYGTSAARVFIGSENFSKASLTENRELGLITSNAGIMAGISTTLTSDFAGGKTYVPDAGTPPPPDAGTPPPPDDAGVTTDDASNGATDAAGE
jgi:cardiolipin synthase A/B